MPETLTPLDNLIPDRAYAPGYEPLPQPSAVAKRRTDRMFGNDEILRFGVASAVLVSVVYIFGLILS